MLDQRLNLLGLADLDYLTARLLINCGLVITGLPKAAEAFEKLLKCFLLLEAKISSNQEITSREMRSFGHGLTEIFQTFKRKVPTVFDAAWDTYLSDLEKYYKTRYPDNWEKQATWQGEVATLDNYYSYLRENIVENFPKEELEKARTFGAAFSTAYNEQLSTHINSSGGMSPLKILQLHNHHLDRFHVAWDV
jgi:hypothetical protein